MGEIGCAGVRCGVQGLAGLLPEVPGERRVLLDMRMLRSSTRNRFIVERSRVLAVDSTWISRLSLSEDRPYMAHFGLRRYRAAAATALPRMKTRVCARSKHRFLSLPKRH